MEIWKYYLNWKGIVFLNANSNNCNFLMSEQTMRQITSVDSTEHDT